MAYPGVARIELPILQELIATGGDEDVRFLYNRLAGYFPQLDETEVRALKNGHCAQWRRLVQRAGRTCRQSNWRRQVAGQFLRGKKARSEEGQSFTVLIRLRLFGRSITHGDIPQSFWTSERARYQAKAS